MFLARRKTDKDEILHYIQDTFGYDLTRSLAFIRPGYVFDVTCRGTVPEAIIAFLESDGYEDCVRKAISLGGDSYTLAARITGKAPADAEPADAAKKDDAKKDATRKDQKPPANLNVIAIADSANAVKG